MRSDSQPPAKIFFIPKIWDVLPSSILFKKKLNPSPMALTLLAVATALVAMYGPSWLVGSPDTLTNLAAWLYTEARPDLADVGQV